MMFLWIVVLIVIGYIIYREYAKRQHKDDGSDSAPRPEQPPVPPPKQEEPVMQKAPTEEQPVQEKPAPEEEPAPQPRKINVTGRAKKGPHYTIASINLDCNGEDADDSVLAVGAFKYEVDWEDDSHVSMRRIASHERYYFAKEPFAPNAKHIDEAFVTDKRKDANYPRYFADDKGQLLVFISGCDLVLGYDLRHVDLFFPELADSGIPLFCIKGNAERTLEELAADHAAEHEADLAKTALDEAALVASIYEEQLMSDSRARRSMGRLKPAQP